MVSFLYSSRWSLRSAVAYRNQPAARWSLRTAIAYKNEPAGRMFMLASSVTGRIVAFNVDSGISELLEYDAEEDTWKNLLRGLSCTQKSWDLQKRKLGFAEEKVGCLLV
jgi:hypothetical protein